MHWTLFVLVALVTATYHEEDLKIKQVWYPAAAILPLLWTFVRRQVQVHAECTQKHDGGTKSISPHRCGAINCPATYLCFRKRNGGGGRKGKERKGVGRGKSDWNSTSEVGTARGPDWRGKLELTHTRLLIANTVRASTPGNSPLALPPHSHVTHIVMLPFLTTVTPFAAAVFTILSVSLDL